MATKRSGKQGESTEMVAISKAYDLVREMSARVDKLPRSRKFVLGEVTREWLRAPVMRRIGHLKHGDTWGLRRKLLHGAVFLGGPKC